MTKPLTYCPHRRSTDGAILDWRVYHPADWPSDACGLQTILAVVQAENAARGLCGLPELPDGWFAWPVRRAMVPGGDLNPANIVHQDSSAWPSEATCTVRTGYHDAAASGIVKWFTPVPPEGTPDASDDPPPPGIGGFATVAAIDHLTARVCRIDAKLDRVLSLLLAAGG